MFAQVYHPLSYVYSLTMAPYCVLRLRMANTCWGGLGGSFGIIVHPLSMKEGRYAYSDFLIFFPSFVFFWFPFVHSLFSRVLIIELSYTSRYTTSLGDRGGGFDLMEWWILDEIKERQEETTTVHTSIPVYNHSLFPGT